MAKAAPSRLGRGLSTIVGNRGTKTPPKSGAANGPAGSNPAHSDAKPVELPIDRIRPNPLQPRLDFDQDALAELASSIKLHGVLQPLVVRSSKDGYDLIAGERRLRAAKQAGLAAVPVVIRDCSDREAAEIALVENLQREDLNAIERAFAYQRYMEDLDATPEALAHRLGQSRSNVLNYTRLLTLHSEVQAMVIEGLLPMGQARAIAGVVVAERQLALARMAVRRNLTTRQVEELAKRGEVEERQAVSRETNEQQGQQGVSRHFAELEHAMSRALGLKVALKPARNGRSGRIVLHYANLDEFDRLSKALGVEE